MSCCYCSHLFSEQSMEGTRSIWESTGRRYDFQNSGLPSFSPLAQPAILAWIVPAHRRTTRLSPFWNIQHLQLNISAKHGWLANAHQSVVQMHLNAAKLNITTCPSHGQVPVMPQSCPWISAPVLVIIISARPALHTGCSWNSWQVSGPRHVHDDILNFGD